MGREVVLGQVTVVDGNNTNRASGPGVLDGNKITIQLGNSGAWLRRGASYTLTAGTKNWPGSTCMSLADAHGYYEFMTY